jgi:hypothetical protein
VGGNTRGILTRVSITGFILESVNASHFARGIEIVNSTSVVTEASFKVSIIGDQSIIQKA